MSKSGNKEKQCDRAFDEYVRFGGMPGSYEYEEAQRYDYIGDVFRTVLIRDLVHRIISFCVV